MISKAERGKLYDALGLFQPEFREYIISFLKGITKDDWVREFEKTLSNEKQRNWDKDIRRGRTPEELIDFPHFKSFADYYKDFLKRDFPGKNQSLGSWLGEIYDVRNKIAHYNGIEEDEAAMVWIHLRTISKFLGKNELVEEIYKLEKSVTEENPSIEEAEKAGLSPLLPAEQIADETFRSSLPVEIKTTVSEKSNESSAPLSIDEPVVAINIAKQYPHVKNAEDLYNSTRGLWRLSKDRAEKAKYAFAVYKRIIREVYDIDRWVSWDAHTGEYWVQKLRSQGTEIDPKVNEGRYQFIGEAAPDDIRNKYIGKEIPIAHAQNPIRYFNC